MRTGVFSLIFAVIAVGYFSSAADARPQHDRHSLDQLLPQIRQQHPGTLYDADGPFTGPDGREHYRIKWVTPEGRVQWLDADAHSGRVTNAPGRYDSFDENRGDDRYDDRNRNVDRNNDGDRRNRFNNDGAADNPFDRNNGDNGNGDDRRRHRDNNDWNNGNGNWDRGNRDDRRSRDNGGFGGWQNNGGGHRHHGH